jgi:hypothetical protein
MTVSHHVEEIFQRYGPSANSSPLQARIIELLVLDPRVSPQGLRTSLRQQARLFHQERTHSCNSEVVDKTLDEIISGLQLQARLGTDTVSTFTRRSAKGAALASLSSKYPWPKQCPTAIAEKVNHFTQSGTLQLLEEAIDELQPKLIVEVGAWLGGTTRWLLTRTPHNVISIDTWLGSSEHQLGTAWAMRQPHHAPLLDQLFETFLAHCWDVRERLIPLRTTSLDGLWQIAHAGLSPELVLLDGAHDEISVGDELELAHELFPTARLIIDDYNRGSSWLRGLVRAVDQFALSHGLTIVEVNGHSCMLLD